MPSSTEYSSDETISKPPYVFSYFDRDINGRDKLPSRVSFAQDHWGYYNGKNENAALIPSYSGPYGTIDPQFDIFKPTCSDGQVYFADSFSFTSQTGDRTPAFPNMRAGSLKSIKYPTGGQAEFEYEAHQGVFTIQEVQITYSSM